jgi:hypothetical protein
MNLYTSIGMAIGTPEATSLCARISAWHDAMVEHERRRFTNSTTNSCDDECPHAEAPLLWTEALASLGSRAEELTFLRSRGRSGAVPREHRRAS